MLATENVKGTRVKRKLKLRDCVPCFGVAANITVKTTFTFIIASQGSCEQNYKYSPVKNVGELIAKESSSNF